MSGVVLSRTEQAAEQTGKTAVRIDGRSGAERQTAPDTFW